MKSRFDTTRWSLVLVAQGGSPEQARSALDDLCRTYWEPLCVRASRHAVSREDAEDLTQGFLAELLRRRDLDRVAPEHGRLRTFLLTSLDHFASNARDAARAAKRGGGAAHVPIDDAVHDLASAAPGADHDYDAAWARAVLALARHALEDEMAAGGKAEIVRVLAAHLDGSADAPSLAEAGQRLGMSEGAVKVALHRLRKRLGRLIRAQIADTLLRTQDVEDELRHLLAALSAPRRDV